ncbi:MAG TPA: AAA family ATPase, partial [Polyangium sp.]|nr:AAA family ATPase [Polyangium sp.]
MATSKSPKQQRKTHSILANVNEILYRELGIGGTSAVVEHVAWLFFLKMIDARDRDATIPYPEELRWRNWAVASKRSSAAHGLPDFVNNELIPGYQRWTPPSEHAERGNLMRAIFESVTNRIRSAEVLQRIIDELNGLDLGFAQGPEGLGRIHDELVKLLRGETESFSAALLAQFLVRQTKPQWGDVILDLDCGAGDVLVAAAVELQKQSPKASLPSGHFRGFETSFSNYLITIVRLMLVGVEVPSGIQFVKGDSPTEWLVSVEPRPNVIMTQIPKDELITRLFKFDRTSDSLTYILDSLPSHGRAAIAVPRDFLGNMLLGVPIKQRLLQEANLYRIDRFGRRRPHQPFGFDADVLQFDKRSSTTEVEYVEHNEYDSDHPSRLNFSWKSSADEIRRRHYYFDLPPPQFQRTSLWLRWLQIQSFRGFEKLVIELPARGPTVLIGINGSGKTSILDAIGLHLASFAAALREEPLRASEVQISPNDVHTGASTAAVVALFDVDGRSESWQIAGPSKKKAVRSGDNVMVDSTRFILEKVHHVANSGIPVVCYYPATRGPGGGDSRDKQTTFAFPQLQAFKYAFGRGLGP